MLFRRVPRIFGIVDRPVGTFAARKAVMSLKHTVDRGTIIAQSNFNRIAEGIWMSVPEVAVRFLRSHDEVPNQACLGKERLKLACLP